MGAVLLGAYCAGAQQTASARDSGGLQRQIEAMVAEPAVARAHWGVMVAGMDGVPLAQVNAGQFFQPASNAKLFTTAAAMALLGPGATVETRVQGYGVWDGAETLRGDLTLVGNGDAFLSGREVPYVGPAARAARKMAAGVAAGTTSGASAGTESGIVGGTASGVLAGTASGAVEMGRPDPLRGLAAMVDQIVASGLKVVDGDVVASNVWEPYPPDWSIEDATWYYGAPVSAMSINDNQLDVVVTPGRQMGETPSVVITPAEPATYALDVSDLRTGAAKTGSHVGWELAMGSKVLRLHGSIAVDAAPDAEGIAIHDPAEFAAMALKGMLEARGVKVSGTARVSDAARTDTGEFTETVKATETALETMWRDNAGFGVAGDRLFTSGRTERVLATRRSPTLMEDVVVTNKSSQNLHAELMLDRLGYVAPPLLLPGGNNQTARGVGVVRAFLTVRVGLDPGDFVFFDGSGLSGHDLVTPRATVKLLEYAAGQPWFAGWKASLPVGGVDGSLVSRFAKAPLQGKVFAKTGTLGEARALSGYVECRSGRTVAFSIFVDAHAPGSSADREVMDRMVAAVWAAE